MTAVCDQLLVPASHRARGGGGGGGGFQVLRSNRCLQAVEGAVGLRDGELSLIAVHCIVISVEGCRSTQATPTSLFESVSLGVVFSAVKEWCSRLVFLQDELRVSHEVMDGASGFGFLEAFVQGATERIHHFDLPEARSVRDKQKKG